MFIFHDQAKDIKSVFLRVSLDNELILTDCQLGFHVLFQNWELKTLKILQSDLKLALGGIQVLEPDVQLQSEML